MTRVGEQHNVSQQLLSDQQIHKIGLLSNDLHIYPKMLMATRTKDSMYIYSNRKGTKMIRIRPTMGLRSSFDALAVLKLIPGKCCDLSLHMKLFCNSIKKSLSESQMNRIEFHKKTFVLDWH